MSQYGHRVKSKWADKGDVFRLQGELEKAIECYKKSLNIQSDYTLAQDGIKAVHLAQSKQRKVTKRHEQLKKQEEIVTPKELLSIPSKDNLQQQNYNDWCDRADHWVSLKHFSDALKCYDHAIAIAPQQKRGWLGMGDVLLSMKEFDAAIDYFGQVLLIDKNDTYALNGQGFALKDKGKYEDALHCFQKTHQLNSKDIDAWIGKAIIANRTSQFDEAIHCCDQALQQDQKHPYAWRHKSVALKSKGDYAGAMACLDTAIKLEPKYEGAWCDKGNIFSAQGKMEEALQCYEKALSIDPTCQEALQGKLAIRTSDQTSFVLQTTQSLSKIPTNADPVIYKWVTRLPPKTTRTFIEKDEIVVSVEAQSIFIYTSLGFEELTIENSKEIIQHLPAIGEKPIDINILIQTILLKCPKLFGTAVGHFPTTTSSVTNPPLNESTTALIHSSSDPAISSANANNLFEEIKTLKVAYQHLNEQSQNRTIPTSFVTTAELEKITEQITTLKPLMDVLDIGKFGKGLLGQFYITLRIHLKELFTAAAAISSGKVQRTDYLVKDKIKSFLGAFAKGALPLSEALGIAVEPFGEIIKTASEVIHTAEFVENILDTSGVGSIIEKGIALVFGPSEEEKLQHLSALIVDNINQDVMMETIARTLTESYKPIIDYLETQGLKGQGIKQLAQHASQRIWGILRRNPKIKSFDRDWVSEQLVAWVSHYPLNIIDRVKDKFKAYCSPLIIIQHSNQKFSLTAHDIFSHAGVAYLGEKQNNAILLDESDSIYDHFWHYFAEKEDSLHRVIGFRRVSKEIGIHFIQSTKTFYAQYWEETTPIPSFIQKNPDNVNSGNKNLASKKEIILLEEKFSKKVKSLEQTTSDLKQQLAKFSFHQNNISVGTQFQQSLTRAEIAPDQALYMSQQQEQVTLLSQKVVELEEEINRFTHERLEPHSSSEMIKRLRDQIITSMQNYIQESKQKIENTTLKSPISSHKVTLFYNEELSVKKEKYAQRIIDKCNIANSLEDLKAILITYHKKDNALAEGLGKPTKTLGQRIYILLQSVDAVLKEATLDQTNNESAILGT